MIDGLLRYWVLVVALVGLVIWLVRLEGSVKELREKVTLSATRAEVDVVRKDVAEVEAETNRQKSGQAQFELSVTNRLTAIETTLSGGLQRIERMIEKALS